jgi:cysteine desulfurase
MQAMSSPIYLDHHATTPVDPRVAASMLRVMTETFGNPNSVEHLYGEEAADLVSAARWEVASLLGADPEVVLFTSGATESIRLAMRDAVDRKGGRKLRVALTTVEHRALIDIVVAYDRLEEVEVCWLPVDSQARVDIAVVEAACRSGVDLLCVMAANNEVGTIYPVQRIAEIAAEAGVSTLVDATQAAGRFPIHAAAWGITYLTVSAHKIYGPKGVGALVVDPRAANEHFANRASDGTANVPGIVGLGEACRLRREEMEDDEPTIARQRDRLEALLVAGIEGLTVNGDPNHRLSNNLHVSIPDIPNDVILARTRQQVALSTGAACSSGAQTPSHVLAAMGLAPELRDGALRIGTGKFTSDEEIEQAGECISNAVAAARHSMSRPRVSMSANVPASTTPISDTFPQDEPGAHP